MHRYVRATRGATRRAVHVARRGARTWWLAPVLAVAVAVDDAVLVPRAPSYAVLGGLDEPAHLATSVVLLSAAGVAARWRGRSLTRATLVAGLVAGNLIDADHLPMVLGSDVLTAGTPRPYSHSLVAVAAVGLVAVRCARRARSLATGPVPGEPVDGPSRRWSLGARIAAGTAIGVGGHLLRDLGTAPVALFWPLTPAGVTIPHAAYLAVLGVAAAVATVGAARHPHTSRRARGRRRRTAVTATDAARTAAQCQAAVPR